MYGDDDIDVDVVLEEVVCMFQYYGDFSLFLVCDAFYKSGVVVVVKVCFGFDGLKSWLVS